MDYFTTLCAPKRTFGSRCYPVRSADEQPDYTELEDRFLAYIGSRNKINTRCCKCIPGTAPSYLCDRLQLYTSSSTLRSASDTLRFQISRTRLSTAGSCAIFCFRSIYRNDLPLLLQQRTSLNSFKCSRKHFFSPHCRPAMFSVPY